MHRRETEQTWGSRILLVEDSEELRGLMQLILEGEGYAVSTATTAEEGLDLLERHPYDLVVSDYALPGHTGIWLLREAVARHLMPEMQGIIVTAHPQVRRGLLPRAVQAARLRSVPRRGPGPHCVRRRRSAHAGY